MTKAKSTRQLKPCGSVAAYSRHIKRGEPVDDDCRAARRTYQAEYRALLPAHLRNSGPSQKDSIAARYRAMVRLSEMEAHRERFTELVAERLSPGQKPSKVYRPARTALAHEFPEEYARLRAEERAKRGLAP